MKPKILITADNKRWKKLLPNYDKLIKTTLEKVFVNLKNISGEVSILLTDDAAIQILNRDYRGKNKPTNVLSFPQNELGLLGDIALSIDTLQREAVEAKKTLADHFTHLLVHGTLHLIGYDHENDMEQKAMEELEIKILANLQIANPY